MYFIAKRLLSDLEALGKELKWKGKMSSFSDCGLLFQPEGL
jgi:hypothetical protein